MVLLTIQQLYRHRHVVVVLGYYCLEWKIPFDLNGLRQQACGEETPFHGNTGQT